MTPRLLRPCRARETRVQPVRRKSGQFTAVDSFRIERIDPRRSRQPADSRQRGNFQASTRQSVPMSQDISSVFVPFDLVAAAWLLKGLVGGARSKEGRRGTQRTVIREWFYRTGRDTHIMAHARSHARTSGRADARTPVIHNIVNSTRDQAPISI